MKRKIVLCVALLILICVVSRLRICKIDSQILILFNEPNVAISSAKQDIRKDFESHGKTPENALNIRYLGLNRSTRYYLCEYTESDGTVSVYYASEDSTWNSSERARVLWDF